MNAKIGKNVNSKFSEQNLSNRNGEHLTDFTLENRLICFNVKFQKRKRKFWIYTNTYHNKVQIYYIFMNKKWNDCSLNCKIYSSSEGVCDHRTAMAKIQWSQRMIKTTVQYNWPMLNYRDIRGRYTLTLWNKCNALQISETPPNDYYESFFNVYLEAAAEYIPTKQRDKPRLTWETLAIRKKRKNHFPIKSEEPNYYQYAET